MLKKDAYSILPLPLIPHVQRSSFWCMVFHTLTTQWLFSVILSTNKPLAAFIEFKTCRFRSGIKIFVPKKSLKITLSLKKSCFLQVHDASQRG